MASGSRADLTLLLVRHGEVEGIAPPRFRGRKDVLLTPLGRRQAETTAAYIAANWRVSAVITSPLARCVDTGAAIAAATTSPASTTDQLTDFDYGEWTWKTHPEVRASWPELYDQWITIPQLVRVPGGDSLQDLFARTADALRAMRAQHKGETVVAVAHDSVNRALLVQLSDLPLSAFWRISQDPCCVNVIEIGTRPQVVTINSTAHLQLQGNSTHPDDVAIPDGLKQER